MRKRNGFINSFIPENEYDVRLIRDHWYNAGQVVPIYEMSEQILWMEANVSEFWCFSSSLNWNLYFTNEDDAAMYRLAWLNDYRIN